MHDSNIKYEWKPMDIKVLIVCCNLLWVTYWRRDVITGHRGSSKNDVTLLWRKSDRKLLLSHFVIKDWPPLENDVKNLWPLPSHKKINCLQIVTATSLRPKHLPVRTLLLILSFLWRCGPTPAMTSSFLRFLDHTQRRTTVGRTPLDEWSARRTDL